MEDLHLRFEALKEEETPCSARLCQIYRLLELNMLCDCVTRGYGDHSPLTTVPDWSRPCQTLVHCFVTCFTASGLEGRQRGPSKLSQV